MRLTRIEFGGYKRLLNTSCNVDSQLVALVGPNEAGKSTVLEALNWLSNGGDLSSETVNRTMYPNPSGPMVTATYAMDSGDREATQGIDGGMTARYVKVAKYVDGRKTWEFIPALARPDQKREAVKELLDSDFWKARIDSEEVSVALDQTRGLLDSGAEWDASDEAHVASLLEWLDLPLPSPDVELPNLSDPSTVPSEDAELSSLIRPWQSQMVRPPPTSEAMTILQPRCPQFLLFSENDRVLSDTYSLTDSTVRNGSHTRLVRHEDVSSPPGGLVNLLAAGGTTMDELYELTQSGDKARLSKRVRRINVELDEALLRHWSQRPLKVRVEVKQKVLDIFIDDGDDTSLYTHRSDGLRMFLALVAFLARHESDKPSVLLIDEADTHLHYDAQADLVDFLLRLDPRTIYTTHSPGCLPPDLGSGIRLIEPDPHEAVSRLRNDFWSRRQSGLTPLLFAMGAGAAAFSAFRAAVFAEGATEMILLPTLMRLATGVETLPYQIVPGLADIPPDQLSETDLAAARVVYLLDGDGGGNIHRSKLVAAGIPSERVLKLPDGFAVEDLVDRVTYLNAVKEILIESGNPGAAKIDEFGSIPSHTSPIAKALSDFLSPGDAPGKTIVASRLIQVPDLSLCPGVADILCELHESIVQLLQIRPAA